MLSFTQIAGFFDHRYLWNDTINVLGFLRNSYKGKIASKTNNFGWAWLAELNHAQTCQD